MIKGFKTVHIHHCSSTIQTHEQIHWIT